MGNFPLDRALAESKRQLEAGGPDVDDSWTVFQARLEGRKPLPAVGARRFPLWWAVGSMAACLAIAAGVFLARPSRVPPPVVLAKPETRLDELKPKKDYHFAVAVAFKPVAANTVTFEQGATAKLLVAAPQGTAWEIKSGSVRVDNHTSNRYTNVFLGGGYRFEELGTAFDLSVDAAAISLSVREGRVRVSREDPPFEKTLSRGESWQAPRVAAPEPKVEPAQAKEPEIAEVLRPSLPGRAAVTSGARFSRDLGSRILVLQGRDLVTFVEETRGGFREASRVTVDLPPQPWFLEVAGPWVILGDRSEYLYFYDEKGTRRGVRVGSLSGSHVYAAAGKILVVNAAGELLTLNPQLQITARDRALSGILFEGCVGDGGKTLYLPDLTAQLVAIDLATGSLRTITLPSPATGNLIPQGPSVRVPGADVLVK